MGEDVEMLEAQVRSLEATVRNLKAEKRDEFAKAALIGYLASFEPTEEPTEYSHSIARDCYKIADAMMEARES